MKKEMLKNDLSVKSIAALAERLTLAGWREKDIIEAVNDPRFVKLNWNEALKVLNGEAEIVIKHHVIDMSIRPYDHGWDILEHNNCELFDFDTQKIDLFLTNNQLVGGFLFSHVLKQIRKKQKAANASVADYLMKYPNLISEEWKEKDGVVFPETIFNAKGAEVSIYIYWRASAKEWSYNFIQVSPELCSGLDSKYPIAIISDK